MPGLHFDDCPLHAFFLPSQPNQRCTSDYICRLHSGCSAQTNKCSSSVVLSPDRCLRLDPVAAWAQVTCCNGKQWSSPSRPVWWPRTTHPAYPQARAWLSESWRCCNYVFPSHVLLRLPWVTVTLGICVYTADVKANLDPRTGLSL